MLTDDDRELRAWTESGKAPAGSCPFCASRISMVQRDGFFRARCSHRGCGATGPKMRSITRAADLFCRPPQRTAGGSAIAARPSTGTVGELLATAREKFDAIEFASRRGDCGDGEWTQINGARGKQYVRVWTGLKWKDVDGYDAMLTGDDYARPARLVAARNADKPPTSRGPL